MKFFVAILVLAFVALAVAQEVQPNQPDQPGAPKQKRGVLIDYDYVPYAYTYPSVYPVVKSYSSLPVYGSYRAGYNHYYHYAY